MATSVDARSEIMTAGEVAELVRCSPGTLRWWRYRTRAEHRQIGPRFWERDAVGNGRGQPVYDRAEVERWLAEQRAAGRASMRRSVPGA